MIKKLAVVGASAALFLAAAVPAFAHHKGVTINNDADVHNTVNTSSNTGYNEIKGWGSKGVKYSDITTGDASSMALVTNNVNSVNVDTCGCSKKLSIDNDATVTNTVNTSSNTGYNKIKGSKVKSSDITTGNADSMGVVTNVVNSTVVGS